MSTRGAIARVKGDGWEGRYHHWDSYPTALGKTLWDLWHGHFRQDTGAMVKFLIDDHPAGWSTINGRDFNKSPGFMEHGSPTEYQTSGPQCYCHGDRREAAEPLMTDRDADCLFIEWVYIFGDNHHMAICEARHVSALAPGQHGTQVDDGFYVHAPVISVDLDAPEPDWEAIENYESASAGQ